jgi:hypothetical protein
VTSARRGLTIARERRATGIMAEPDGAETEFSLTRGGSFHRLLRRTGIVSPGRRNALRPGIVFALLTWGPIALAGAVEWLATGKPPRVVLDPAVHARLVVAIPLFFAAEPFLDERTAHVFRSLADDFVVDRAVAKVIARRAERMRDSQLVEAALLAGSIYLGLAIVFRHGSSGLVHGMELESGLSAALLWYALVAFPVFQFLLLRLLYRWGIWCRMLASFSRVDLRLMPTHPDLAGGIGFLAHPVQPFGLLTFACATIAAASWGYRVAVFDADPQLFSPIFIAFVAIELALALGPLLFFSRKLVRARIQGIRQYEDLALRYTRLFHERWIVGPGEPSLLGTPDIQSLADLGNSFERVEKMRFVPFGTRPVLFLVAAAAIPMMPLLAMKEPVPELFAKLGHALLGRLAP